MAVIVEQMIEKEKLMSHPKVKSRVVIAKDGPYLVTGDIPLSEQIIETDGGGGSESWEQGETHKT